MRITPNLFSLVCLFYQYHGYFNKKDTTEAERKVTGLDHLPSLLGSSPFQSPSARFEAILHGREQNLDHRSMAT